MKKLFVRWSAALGIAGSVLLGSSFVAVRPVLAQLTEAQLLEKLQGVPVFTIGTSERKSQQEVIFRPLPVELSPTTPPNAAANNPNQTVTVYRFFVSPRDAQAFFNQLKQQDPQIPTTVEVGPMPLGAVYQAAKARNNEAEKVQIEPAQQQVDAAKTLMQQSGQSNQQVNLPLFIVRFGPDKGYVSIKLPPNNAEIIPIFFSKEDAQGLLDQVKPQFAGADIQVVDINSVIENWMSRNDAWLKQVELIPPPEAREFLRSLQGGAGHQNRPAPQASPAPQNRPAP